MSHEVGKPYRLRTNVSTCQPLRRWRAVGSSSILASLRLGGCAEMPVSARCVEQAIPRVSTLDWGGKTRRARASGRERCSQCRTPLALGAQRSPTPVKGGIAHAPGWQDRHGIVGQPLPGQKKAQTARLSRWGEPCPYPCCLTLTGKSTKMNRPVHPLCWVARSSFCRADSREVEPW
jgi:hypothetical protein